MQILTDGKPKTPHSQRRVSAPNILAVESDQEVRELLGFQLQQLGYNVASAGDASEALQLVRQGFHPSGVLLDVVLPHMDGYELLMHLRSLEGPQNRLLPAVFLSDNDEYARIAEGRKLGGIYVTKPVDLLDLRVALSDAFNAPLREGRLKRRSAPT